MNSLIKFALFMSVLGIASAHGMVGNTDDEHPFEECRFKLVKSTTSNTFDSALVKVIGSETGHFNPCIKDPTSRPGQMVDFTCNITVTKTSSREMGKLSIIKIDESQYTATLTPIRKFNFGRAKQFACRYLQNM